MAKEKRTGLKEEIDREKTILGKEIKKEQAGLKWFFKSHTFKIILTLAIFAGLLSSVHFLAAKEGKIYVEDAQIIAPVIKLSPQQAGILDKVYVREGDFISSNTIVARVNSVSIKSMIAGVVIGVENTPGQYVTPQNSIVEMIDPDELRVIGRVKENKGLNDIKKGQKVMFTVDAYGSNEYEGVVDMISPAARNGDLVFSISDKRQEQEFDVSVKYAVSSYPELLQGMSAKMWIYK